MLFSPLAQFDVICIVPLFWGNYEISITNLSLTAIITMILGIFILYVFFNEQIVPRNWQIILESLFMFVFRVIKQQTGNEGLIYFPLDFLYLLLFYF